MWRDSIHGQRPAAYSRQQSLPCRARYDAYGVGLVVFVLLQAVERRLGILLRTVDLPIVLLQPCPDRYGRDSRLAAGFNEPWLAVNRGLPGSRVRYRPVPR